MVFKIYCRPMSWGEREIRIVRKTLSTTVTVCRPEKLKRKTKEDPPLWRDSSRQQIFLTPFYQSIRETICQFLLRHCLPLRCRLLIETLLFRRAANNRVFRCHRSLPRNRNARPRSTDLRPSCLEVLARRPKTSTRPSARASAPTRLLTRTTCRGHWRRLPFFPTKVVHQRKWDLLSIRPHFLPVLRQAIRIRVMGSRPPPFLRWVWETFPASSKRLRNRTKAFLHITLKFRRFGVRVYLLRAEWAWSQHRLPTQTRTPRSSPTSRFFTLTSI